MITPHTTDKLEKPYKWIFALEAGSKTDEERKRLRLRGVRNEDLTSACEGLPGSWGGDLPIQSQRGQA